MNKSQNNYRKCAFCPHHSQQIKCCCKKQVKKNQIKKNIKTRATSLRNQSSIELADYSQLGFQGINLPTLIAQNSFLKSENRGLKKDILSISHYIKQDKDHYRQQYTSIGASNYLKTQNELLLSDRLYISNKNLQQAILKVDSLSRQNKQLQERNIILSSQLSSLKIQNQQQHYQIETLRNKIKKSIQKLNQSQSIHSMEKYQVLKQKYQNLKIRNDDLQQQLQRLKEQFSNKSRPSQGNLSPEWIAETSNKLSYIENKIDNAQQNYPFINKTTSHPHTLNSTQNINSSYYELMNNIKKELALSINIVHARTRKYSSVFDNVGNIQNINMTSLICSLVQGFVESAMNLGAMMHNQLNRKIISLEKRMQFVLGNLENLILKIKNRELRDRSVSRSRISNTVNKQNINSNLISKNYLNSKSPIPQKYNNQNFNSLNRIDKTL